MTLTNPVVAQDRAEDLLDNWRKYGYAMFRQQKYIYRGIADHVLHKSVLEAGAGAGTGGLILADAALLYWGTDGLDINVRFAKEVYPTECFTQWDITKPWGIDTNFDTVVAVEVLEHVADAPTALRNLMGVPGAKEVWLSTPNGTGKPCPPSNPCHVQEFAPDEIWDMAGRDKALEIYHWETFERLDVDTLTDPLVYRIPLV